MNCRASATLSMRSAFLMTVMRVALVPASGWQRSGWKREPKTLAYRSLYTSRVWCLYWQRARRKHGIQQHRDGAPGKTRISAASGVRQAGKHFRHGGVPQAVRRGGKGLRRLLGSPRARDAAVVQALHQDAGRIEGSVLPLVPRR